MNTYTMNKSILPSQKSIYVETKPYPELEGYDANPRPPKGFRIQPW